MIEVQDSDFSFTNTRTIDAPRARVFAAWTTAEILSRWWGPKGFTNTFETFEPKPGGDWKFVMHGPDGTDYKNVLRFVEVVAPERLVFDHTTGPKYHAVVSFAADGGKTRITWTMRFETAAAWEGVKAFAPQGNEQNLDKLEALLAGGT